jgi:hypothetical protein
LADRAPIEPLSTDLNKPFLETLEIGCHPSRCHQSRLTKTPMIRPAEVHQISGMQPSRLSANFLAAAGCPALPADGLVERPRRHRREFGKRSSRS